MATRTLTKEAFKAFVQGIIRAGRTAGVKCKENKFAFGELSDASELVLDYDVALHSPKVFFQPPREKLFDFRINNTAELEPSVESEPFVLIGIHTYDLKALNQMDRIWEMDNKDEHYLARRRAATIIAMEPVRASKWSFWAFMDAASVHEGFDLLLTDIADKYVVEIGTDRGGALLSRHAPNSVDAKPEELKAREDVRRNLVNLCNKDREIEVKYGEISSLIRNNMEHPIWEKQAEKCYSCGSCNLVCPTCYCFEVRDMIELDMRRGSRSRYWDGCLLEEFAAVGSGENFREERAARFRHRILRKTVFVADRIGELACVGCGRCSEACLPDITDPVKIINAIKEGS